MGKCCSGCGLEVEDWTVYCPVCGTILDEKTAVKAQTEKRAQERAEKEAKDLIAKQEKELKLKEKVSLTASLGIAFFLSALAFGCQMESIFDVVLIFVLCLISTVIVIMINTAAEKIEKKTNNRIRSVYTIIFIVACIAVGVFISRKIFPVVDTYISVEAHQEALQDPNNIYPWMNENKFEWMENYKEDILDTFGEYYYIIDPDDVPEELEEYLGYYRY